MSTAPVHLKGRTEFRRTQRGHSIDLRHDTEVAMDARAAVIRFTCRETGLSEAIPITDRRALYLLQKADEAMVRTARRTEEVESMFKDPKRKKARPEWEPPAGFVFCPECLGCPELSQYCLVCDGERVVRETNDGE